MKGFLGAVAVMATILVPVSAGAAVQPEGAPRQPTDTVTQLIVRYKTDPSDAQLRGRMEVAKRAGAFRGVALAHARRGALGMHVLSVGRRIAVADALQLARDLAASDPNIEYAEPDYVLVPAFTPNDTAYPAQWNYQNSTGGIYAPDAWDLTTGSGVRVAVVDTGYRPHADLAANIVGGYDFITDPVRARDGNGRDSNASDEGNWQSASDCGDFTSANSTWHGTHVAGTVAAVTNNATGVAGVAFGARVVPVRVLGRCGGVTSDIVDAIYWAAGGSVPGVPANAYPARVINLSMSNLLPAPCGASFQNAITNARALNAVVVVSAGNTNQTQDHQPGNCWGVITVAANDANGGKASYSNYGANVALAAPGGGSFGLIRSTGNTGTTTPVADAYTDMVGTSMAAPHVSAVAAMIIARNSGLSPDHVKFVLQSTARAFPATCTGCGSGILQATQAVTLAPQVVWVRDQSSNGSMPSGPATAYFMLDTSGDSWVSYPYGAWGTFGPWITPKSGMSNYEGRAINSSCYGPTTWTNLGTTGATWAISTGGMDGEMASCGMDVQIRRVSDGVILTTGHIDMTAYTGFW